MADPGYTSLIFNTSLSAFIGAFFSYLFVRFAEVMKAIYDRQIAGFNGLIQVERWLLGRYNIITNNLFIIEGAVKNRNGPHISVDFTELHQITFDIKLLDKLLNVVYVNELARFGSDICKLDYTIETLNRMHREIRAAVISKTIDPETYKGEF